MHAKKSILGIKKILVILFLFFSFFSPLLVYWWVVCDVRDVKNIWESLDACLNDSKLVNSSGDVANGWFWKKVNLWTVNIAKVFWVLAVWSIVYWALLLVVSVWEEEKIKKAKEVIKWWIIGFLWIVAASTVIALVVNIMYSIPTV